MAKYISFFFFPSRSRHTRLQGDWSQTCALPISADGGADRALVLPAPAAQPRQHLLGNDPASDCPVGRVRDVLAADRLPVAARVAVRERPARRRDRKSVV